MYTVPNVLLTKSKNSNENWYCLIQSITKKNCNFELLFMWRVFDETTEVIWGLIDRNSATLHYIIVILNDT